MKTRPHGVALALLLAGSVAMAGEQGAAVAPARSEPARKLVIPDEQLVDQDGRPVRLYSDLMKGRVVAVNFVFTTCSTICSPMTAVFSRLQKELGERLGKDVYLISISLDPAADTPERLARYAGKFDRREGWTFVTGPAERVQRALTALGGAVATKESHTPVVLLGNEATGEWTRAYGLSAPTQLAGQLEALLSRNPKAPRKNPPSTARNTP
ncbi:protein SCO1/2 [Archangium gephyra]|uniref:Cytochrome oxidase biogenesis protein Sco1/SenC/PrrC, putative copper metallochaperone n=1 Tax=Archangium gephyra TaxID=48 RepID=A0AAC8TG99_9BACT|nr:SCO family protein [Archangium gephyra]AKJ04858.1 Cytochrome oxidase biogenesis protein Sco1/SenC/PrrC, putative copper metallochaperone [Archangium gephyra]REG37097.1 protein SCO1/2 [Archangium gephyra]